MAGDSIRFNASLNTAGFDSGAARLQQIAAQTSSRVSGAFAAMGAKIAAVVAPFVGLYAAINSVKNALDLGGRLNDLSKTTGETAGNLAVLQRAFANAGVGSEKLGPALAAVANFVTDLGNAMPGAQMAASGLKVSFEDLAGKSPIEQMQVLLAAIAAIPDPSKRAALAMDVFKKAGRDIVPLAQDFSIELANARGELGSLPRILSENASSLDELGDKLTNSVGNKLTELAVGLAAGATGADNFVTALSKIDAAGFGEKIGNALRAAFAAPLEVLQSIGDVLISGILKAGNALVGAFKYANDVFAALFTDQQYWNAIGERIKGALGSIGTWLVTTLIEQYQKAFQALANIPFFGDYAKEAADALESVKQQVLAVGEAFASTYSDAGQKITDAWDRARESAKFVYDDVLGAEYYSKSASDHWQNAQEAAAQINQHSAETAENFGKGSAAITKALEGIRGFALDGGDPVAKPNWFKSSEPPPSSGGGGTGGGGGGRSGGGRSGEQKWGDGQGTADERVGAMRAQAAYDRATARGSEYLGRGAYRSKAMAEMRGEREANRRMTDALIRQDAKREGFGDVGSMFQKGYNNGMSLGREEKLRSDMEKAGLKYDPAKADITNYQDLLRKEKTDQMMREQAKTPDERKKEEEDARNRSRPPGGGGDSGKGGKQQSELSNVVTEIQSFKKEVIKRLPIRVIGKG